ncbi:putative SAC1 phosphoinositide phosphatase [Besnoitia besnoiti]|uniref:Putative SAC1 phosphoinositide phosphatase n=1 Tax=Besnoitia besnoiti TaxID=94643 RepID=A0A2A9M6M3_BESBE|nr:putative SAC1 phosphoinositide phosphatase [Besnoitia besnoiti]PFH33635.1 putative SAC1 phosphoinositide phosphatase [Besnoitia besnoiti]
MEASALLSPPFTCDIHRDALVLRSLSLAPSQQLTFSYASTSPSASPTVCFSVAAGPASATASFSPSSSPSSSSRSALAAASRAPRASVPCYGVFGVTQIFGCAYVICIESCRLLGFLGQAPLLQISSFHLVQVPPAGAASSALSRRTLRRRRFLQTSRNFLVGATVTVTSQASSAAARIVASEAQREADATTDGSLLLSSTPSLPGAEGRDIQTCADAVRTDVLGKRLEPPEAPIRPAHTSACAGDAAGAAVASDDPRAPPPPGVRTPLQAVAEQWLTLLCDGLCEGAFYFSPALDLTKNLQTQLGGGAFAAAHALRRGDSEKKQEGHSTSAPIPSPTRSAAKDDGREGDGSAWTARFSVNRHFLEPITTQTPEAFRFCAQVIQGYVGMGLLSYSVESCSQLCIISRRDSSRAGVRFHSRGINAAGNASNLVETEQLLLVYTFREAAPPPLLLGAGAALSSTAPFFPQPHNSRQSAAALRGRGYARLDVFAFLQIRGSIPLVWKQTPTLKWAPAPSVIGSPEENSAAASRHFSGILKNYGPITVVSLVNKKGREKALGDLFEQTVIEQKSKDLSFVWFDFHQECSRMQWNNLSRLLAQVHKQLNHQHYFHAVCTLPAEGDAESWPVGAPGAAPTEEPFFTWHNPLKFLPGWRKTEVLRLQRGLFRVNCIDCLDRTNVVQSVFGKRVLAQLLTAVAQRDAVPLASQSAEGALSRSLSLSSSSLPSFPRPAGAPSDSSSSSSSVSPAAAPAAAALSAEDAATRASRLPSSLLSHGSASVERSDAPLQRTDSERERGKEKATSLQATTGLPPLAPLPFTPAEGDQLFRDLWTDNADALSLLYSGTPALKTDFTRTGVRSAWGALNDARNSLVRYFLNNFFDGYKQDCFTFFFQAACYPCAPSSLLPAKKTLSPPRPLDGGLRRVFLEAVLLVFSLFCVSPFFVSSLFSGVYTSGYSVTGALLALATLPFRLVSWPLSFLPSLQLLRSLPMVPAPFSAPDEPFGSSFLFGASVASVEGLAGWAEPLKSVGGVLWIFTFSLFSFVAYIFLRAAAVVSLPQLLPDVS